MRHLILVFAASLMAIPSYGDTASTLTLDSLSYVALGTEEILSVPPGTEIQFRFGKKQPDGSIPLTVPAAGAGVLTLPLRSTSGALRYRLSSTASGVMRKSAGGYQLELSVPLQATVVRDGRSASLDYLLNLTTGASQFSLRGSPLDLSSRHVQLVSAIRNRPDADPAPDQVVEVVLSGTFDVLP